jgi:hypothetical protein
MSPSFPLPDEVLRVVSEVLHPRNFFVGNGLALDWQGPVREDVPWEVFRGRLLDCTQTRAQGEFLAWNVHALIDGAPCPEPVLSVKLDGEAGRLHVVRGLPCHVWEGYDSGNSVILSRETVRWVRELVGTLDLAAARDLRRELSLLVSQAVVGTSRLPLTSVEAPLPAFSLGQLAYFPQAAAEMAGALGTVEELLTGALTSQRSLPETARLLEFVLRSAPASELEAAACRFAERWASLGHSPREIPRLLRAVFNEVALSPWTDFAGNALTFLQLLVRQGTLTAEEEIDFLGYLLRQLCRHLTAYDLVIFHHRGANYPDALLLDIALKRYLALVAERPECFSSGDERARIRRRALRQGWLLRRRYEGHAVPDAPTSPGENARVLPPPHVRVPEEQILQAGRRRRRLFAGEGLGERGMDVLRQSIDDLLHPDELCELGKAVFVDRPLGVFKAPVEMDQTLLFSHEAFSRSLARDRLSLAERLELLPDAARRDTLRQRLRDLPVSGLPVSEVQCDEGRIVSLADARRAADDFLLLRTTRRSLDEFLERYDLSALAARFDLGFLTRERRALIVPAPIATGAEERVLTVYDAWLRPRLELGWRRQWGYEVCGGAEHPRGGLQVLGVRGAAVGEQAERQHDLRHESFYLRPRACPP